MPQKRVCSGKKKSREVFPDGMRVDEAGNLHVTGPKGIWVWDPQGHYRDTIVVPEQPANLTRGDSDYRSLYTTTSICFALSDRSYRFRGVPEVTSGSALFPLTMFDVLTSV
jgi:sugar lactone lactonase YvrE